MKIKYKVISIDPKNQSFVVRYYTDVATEDALAIIKQNGVVERCLTDVNIEYNSESDVRTLIQKHAPIQRLKKQEKITRSEIMFPAEKLEQLLNKEVEFNAQENNEMTDQEIDALLQTFKMNEQTQ